MAQTTSETWDSRWSSTRRAMQPEVIDNFFEDYKVLAMHRRSNLQMTNKGGKYTIQNVPATTQTVVASKAGYLSQQKDVLVVAGSTVTLNFTLAPE